jgi:hypothetical protein
MLAGEASRPLGHVSEPAQATMRPSGLPAALRPHQPHDLPVSASVWADAHSG